MGRCAILRGTDMSEEMDSEAQLEPDGRTNRELEVSERSLLMKLSGPGGAHLRSLEKELGVGVGMRGNCLHLSGPEEGVIQAERVLLELLHILEERELTELEIVRAARTARTHPETRLRELFEDVVLVTSHRKTISPRGLAQQMYIQAIRRNDIVFGVGPAGTGKTYLAMAMAVKALQSQRVRRIILTRPAVEAASCTRRLARGRLLPSSTTSSHRSARRSLVAVGCGVVVL